MPGRSWIRPFLQHQKAACNGGFRVISQCEIADGQRTTRMPALALTRDVDCIFP